MYRTATWEAHIPTGEDRLSHMRLEESKAPWPLPPSPGALVVWKRGPFLFFFQSVILMRLENGIQMSPNLSHLNFSDEYPTTLGPQVHSRIMWALGRILDPQGQPAVPRMVAPVIFVIIF